MFSRQFALAGLAPLFLIAVFSGLALSPRPVAAEGPAKAREPDAKVLRKERLTVLREIAKLAADALKAGTGSVDEVREADRAVARAELELCGSDKERIAVLEKIVAQAKKVEEQATRLSKHGVVPTTTALRARADRLQAEADLAQATAKAARPASSESSGPVLMAEKQVALKQAAVKVAEVHKRIAVARLESAKAQLAEAQAADEFAQKQLKRIRQLLETKAVSSTVVDEQQSKAESARARYTAARSKVTETEAQVLLEQARIELAITEVGEAELRLKLLKAGTEKKP